MCTRHKHNECASSAAQHTTAGLLTAADGKDPQLRGAESGRMVSDEPVSLTEIRYRYIESYRGLHNSVETVLLFSTFLIFSSFGFSIRFENRQHR